jgi:hypothetical protein
LPDELAARIEAEAVERKMSISDVIRKHLSFAHSHNPRRDLFEAITDVVRLAVAEPLPHAERSPNPDPLSDAARSPDADPLPDADALPDEPSTRKKAASRRAKRSESAP